MNIIDAAKAMKEGKKVRRKIWNEGLSAYTEDDIVLFTDRKNDFVVLNLGACLADDWEIYEERSPMDKAWKEYESELKMEGKGILKQFVKKGFDKAWNTATKHFTEK